MAREIEILLLNYAPGLLKEVASIRRLLLGAGLSVRIIANKRFSAAARDAGIETESVGPKTLLGHACRLFTPRSVKRTLYIYNNNPLNPVFALLGKLNGDIVGVCCHEPKKSLAGMGALYRARRAIANANQDFSLFLADFAVLLSENAKDRFQKSYPRFKGSIVTSRILVPDALPHLQDIGERRFLCLPGKPSDSTGHELFYEIAPAIARAGIPICLLHVGAPSSSWWTTPKELSDQGLIPSPDRLTDADIERVFRMSWAVIRLDETSAQSGTIPVAFMTETPVIVRDRPGQHGEIGGWISAEEFLVPIQQGVIERRSGDEMHRYEGDQ